LETSYPFISSYLKGEEMKLLRREQLNRVLAADSVPEALRIIKETDIGAFLEASPIRTFDEIDSSLWRYLDDCAGRVNNFHFLPENIKLILEAYKSKYDVFNIKAALTGQLFHQGVRLIPAGTIKDRGFSERLASAKNSSDIIELLIDCNLLEFAEVLAEFQDGEGPARRRLLERELDTTYYANLINVSRDSRDISILPKAFGTIVDMENLKMICRAIMDGSRLQIMDFLLADLYLISIKTMREMLVQEMENLPRFLEKTPYENSVSDLVDYLNKSGKTSMIEEVLENRKIRLLEQLLSPITFVPAMIIWYLITKEIEIRNLRLALKAIIDKIPAEKITGYMVLL
jgi:vacuolar-type H+-ATPase subunit C/Vma6